MGAPVEGWPPQRIASRFDNVRQFLPPTHSGDPAAGKGAGRITDDTLMAEALIRAYIAHGDHLDAWDFAQYFIPEIANTKVWVPERQAEMPILQRLWWPEKYPWLRLTLSHAEPRSAGIGNCVNCGLAMYMLPIGAVNAGDPQGAYDEAAAFGLAHNESFALEAGAVMAACHAAALGDGATIDAVLAAAATLAREGTADAVKACIDAGRAARDAGDSIAAFIQRTRAAVAPFDQRTGHTTDDAPLLSTDIDTGRPSRRHSIEELPVALACLVYGNGDFDRTLHAGVFYGRDCDSIAGMAGGLFGGIFGLAAVPEDLRKSSDAANRRNLMDLAMRFAPVVKRILAADEQRMGLRRAAVGS